MSESRSTRRFVSRLARRFASLLDFSRHTCPPRRPIPAAPRSPARALALAVTGVLALCAVAPGSAAAATAQEAAQATLTPRQAGLLEVGLAKQATWDGPRCPGGEIDYQVTIRNNNSVGASARLVDPIPEDTTYVQDSADDGAEYKSQENQVVWTGLLLPGQEHTIHFSVRVDSNVLDGTEIANEAIGELVSDVGVGQDRIVARTDVDCSALDLEVEKLATYTSPLACPGGEIFYEVRFTNRTDRARTLDARLVDPIPGDATFDGNLSPGAADYDPGANEVTWEGPLDPGETRSVTFSVTVDSTADPGETITNTATVTLSDPVEGDTHQEQAEVAVSCPAPLSIELEKQSTPEDPLCRGSVIDYELTLANPLANGEPVDASLTDPIPTGTELVPGSLETIPKNPAAVETNGVVEWRGRLDAGQRVEIRFQVRVKDTVVTGTKVENKARAELVDLQGQDSVVAEVKTEDEVECLDIELDKQSATALPLCPRGSIKYFITLTNPAVNGKALQAAIVDPIPRRTRYAGGLTAVGGRKSKARFDRVAREVEWQGTLDPGQSVTVSFLVTVRSGTPPGFLVTNVADAILRDPDEQKHVTDRVQVQDQVADDCDPIVGCPLEVDGFVEESQGNGQGRRYPVPGSRVGLFDLENDPLPVAPLSEGKHEAIRTTRTSRTSDGELRDEEFTAPGRAGYAFDVSDPTVSSCPPRTAVVSALWDGEDRFAVAPPNPVGGRYVPAYLARCVSDMPDEVLPAGPCFLWRWQPTELTYVPWDPVADEPAEVSFTYGRSPANRDSTRVIHDPATSDPPLSEAWDLDPTLPPDFFFQDAAHMYFFTAKAMDSLDALAGQVRGALEEIAEAEGGEAPELAPSPVLITPHDEDCPGGCTWSGPQLQDDPLEPLPGRLPLDFGGLGEGGVTVSAGALVAFDPDHSSSRFIGIPNHDTGDKPDNREWHELGHWWMLQLYGGDWPGAYRNDAADCREEPPAMPPVPARFGNGHHCGYANRSTTDSYIEGFAELTSLWIAESHGDRQPFLYHLAGNDRNLEVDHQVWGPYVAGRSGGELDGLELLDPRDEDFAVAGLLWDLLDGGTLEPKAPGLVSDAIATEDRMEAPAADLFARIRAEGPEDLASLYDALAPAFPADTDGDGFSDLEEVFIAHGAFADAERDLRHDTGESLGDTGSSKLPARPVRLAREPAANGFFDYGVTVDGFPFAPFGFPVDVRYEFEPPFDQYDYERTLRSRGRLHLHAPPPFYPCRVTITVRGRDDFADRRSEPLELPCREYWSTVESGAPSLGRHTFVLEEGLAPEPPVGAWLTSAALPGFEAKVQITPRGGEPVTGDLEPGCIAETLCVSGALGGRPEVFIKVIGPRPNGKLWTQISRFTPSQVEVWLHQPATGTVRYYRLDPVGPGSGDVSGLQDREAFDPVEEGSSVASRRVVLPGAAVEPLPPAASFGLASEVEAGEPAPPAGIDWRTTPELPGFRFKARITAGDRTIPGGRVDRCIPETLCIHGALAGRPEVFVKLIGPRPNGFLWVQAARFTPSQVELWAEQTATGALRYYRLGPIGPGMDDVSGLQDRQAFQP